MKKTTKMLTIVGALLLLTGAVLLWQGVQEPVEPGPINNNGGDLQNRCASEDCETILSQFKEFADLSIVLTRGWHVYRDDEHDFRLSYPNDWVLLREDNSEYGRFVEGGFVYLLSPGSFQRYFVDPLPGTTERTIDLSVFLGPHDKALNDYQEYIEAGFTNKAIHAFYLEDSNQPIEAFIYTTISGLTVVSIPASDNFSVNFMFDLLEADLSRDDLITLKTIINSLEFED